MIMSLNLHQNKALMDLFRSQRKERYRTYKLQKYAELRDERRINRWSDMIIDDTYVILELYRDVYPHQYFVSINSRTFGGDVAEKMYRFRDFLYQVLETRRKRVRV